MDMALGILVVLLGGVICWLLKLAADEIQFTVSGTFKNPSAGGGFSDSIPSETFKFVQSTQGYHGPIWAVGTAEEDLVVGDIATNGWLYMRNLDTTNFVKYGPKSAGAMIEFGRLKAGEFAIFRLAAGVTLRAIADTAAVKVQVKLLND